MSVCLCSCCVRRSSCSNFHFDTGGLGGDEGAELSCPQPIPLTRWLGRAGVVTIVLGFLESADGATEGAGDPVAPVGGFSF